MTGAKLRNYRNNTLVAGFEWFPPRSRFFFGAWVRNGLSRPPIGQYSNSAHEPQNGAVDFQGFPSFEVQGRNARLRSGKSHFCGGALACSRLWTRKAASNVHIFTDETARWAPLFRSADLHSASRRQLAGGSGMQITNLRYGRLKICATHRSAALEAAVSQVSNLRNIGAKAAPCRLQTGATAD